MSAIKREIEWQMEQDEPSEIPSCFTCKHVKTWDDPGDFYQPPDKGWECGHPNQELVSQDWIDPPDDVIENEEKFAEHCAKSCSCYEYFNWQEYHAHQDDALASEVEAQKMYTATYKEFGVIE